MKKINLIIPIISILIFISGCGQSAAYTKEFPYLPAYPGMTFLSGSDTPDAQGYKNIMYDVKNTEGKVVLDEYEKLLNGNGWKTASDNKPESIVVEKNTHRAIIVATVKDKDTYLTVVAK